MSVESIQQYEAAAKAFLDKAVAGLKALQGFETVQHVEDAFPAAKHLAERLLAAVPIVGEVENIADALTAAYAFAQLFGIKPEDANQMAADDAKFHPGMSAD